jgi:hypothetical protein
MTSIRISSLAAGAELRFTGSAKSRRGEIVREENGSGIVAHPERSPVSGGARDLARGLTDTREIPDPAGKIADVWDDSSSKNDTDASNREFQLTF